MTTYSIEYKCYNIFYITAFYYLDFTHTIFFINISNIQING